MKVNTSDHSDDAQQNKTVPAGRYTLRVGEPSPGVVQSEKAKYKGERKFDVKLIIQSDDEDKDGHGVFDTFTLVESQQRKLKQFLRALGYEEDVNLIVDEDEDEEEDDVENVYLAELNGEELEARIKVQPGSKDYGKKNQVDRYIPLSDQS